MIKDRHMVASRLILLVIVLCLLQIQSQETLDSTAPIGLEKAPIEFSSISQSVDKLQVIQVQRCGEETVILGRINSGTPQLWIWKLSGDPDFANPQGLLSNSEKVNLVSGEMVNVEQSSLQCNNKLVLISEVKTLSFEETEQLNTFVFYLSENKVIKTFVNDASSSVQYKYFLANSDSSSKILRLSNRFTSQENQKQSGEVILESMQMNDQQFERHILQDHTQPYKSFTNNKNTLCTKSENQEKQLIRCYNLQSNQFIASKQISKSFNDFEMKLSSENDFLFLLSSSGNEEFLDTIFTYDIKESEKQIEAHSKQKFQVKLQESVLSLSEAGNGSIFAWNQYQLYKFNSVGEIEQNFDIFHPNRDIQSQNIDPLESNEQKTAVYYPKVLSTNQIGIFDEKYNKLFIIDEKQSRTNDDLQQEQNHKEEENQMEEEKTAQQGQIEQRQQTPQNADEGERTQEVSKQEVQTDDKKQGSQSKQSHTDYQGKTEGEQTNQDKPDNEENLQQREQTNQDKPENEETPQQQHPQQQHPQQQGGEKPSDSPQQQGADQKQQVIEKPEQTGQLSEAQNEGTQQSKQQAEQQNDRTETEVSTSNKQTDNQAEKSSSPEEQAENTPNQEVQSEGKSNQKDAQFVTETPAQDEPEGKQASQVKEPDGKQASQVKEPEDKQASQVKEPEDKQALQAQDGANQEGSAEENGGQQEVATGQQDQEDGKDQGDGQGQQNGGDEKDGNGQRDENNKGQGENQGERKEDQHDAIVQEDGTVQSQAAEKEDPQGSDSNTQPDQTARQENAQEDQNEKDNSNNQPEPQTSNDQSIESLSKKETDFEDLLKRLEIVEAQLAEKQNQNNGQAKLTQERVQELISEAEKQLQAKEEQKSTELKEQSEKSLKELEESLQKRIEERPSQEVGEGSQPNSEITSKIEGFGSELQSLKAQLQKLQEAVNRETALLGSETPDSENPQGVKEQLETIKEKIINLNLNHEQLENWRESQQASQKKTKEDITKQLLQHKEEYHEFFEKLQSQNQKLASRIEDLAANLEDYDEDTTSTQGTQVTSKKQMQNLTKGTSSNSQEYLSVNSILIGAACIVVAAYLVVRCRRKMEAEFVEKPTGNSKHLGQSANKGNNRNTISEFEDDDDFHDEGHHTERNISSYNTYAQSIKSQQENKREVDTSIQSLNYGAETTQELKTVTFQSQSSRFDRNDANQQIKEASPNSSSVIQNQVPERKSPSSLGIKKIPKVKMPPSVAAKAEQALSKYPGNYSSQNLYTSQTQSSGSKLPVAQNEQSLKQTEQRNHSPSVPVKTTDRKEEEDDFDEYQSAEVSQYDKSMEHFKGLEEVKNQVSDTSKAKFADKTVEKDSGESGPTLEMSHDPGKMTSSVQQSHQPEHQEQPDDDQFQEAVYETGDAQIQKPEDKEAESQSEEQTHKQTTEVSEDPHQAAKGSAGSQLQHDGHEDLI